MVLNSAGNLGLGVTPSASNLPTMQSTYALISGNSQVNILQNAYYNSGFLFTGTGYATQYQQLSGEHRWKVSTASGTAGNAVTFTQAMTLDASGNLGLASGTLFVNKASGNAQLRTGVNTDAGLTTGEGIEFSTTSSTGTRVLAYDRGAGAFRRLDLAGNTIQMSPNNSTSVIVNGYGLGLGATTPSSGTGIAFPATQSASSDANTLDDYEEGTWTPVWTGSTSGSGSPGSITGHYVKVGKMVIVSVAMNDANPFITFVGTLRCSLPFPVGGTITSQYIGPTIYFYNGAQWNTGSTTAGITPYAFYNTSYMEFGYMLVNDNRQNAVTHTSSSGLSNGGNVYARFSFSYAALD
jgi:hypothetical protein